jgi:hypothetical protein
MRKRLPLFLLGIITFWSVTLGWGISLALDFPFSFQAVKVLAQSNSNSPKFNNNPIPERYQAGRALYVENCSTCHLAIPPEVLATETWQKLLEKPQQHYGQSIPPMVRISQVVVWEYLKDFSRSVSKDEPVPFYVQQSRYFKALHPRVNLPPEVNPKTCITCHPGANNFEFRSLTPQWDNAP